MILARKARVKLRGPNSTLSKRSGEVENDRGQREDGSKKKTRKRLRTFSGFGVIYYYGGG